VIVFVLMVSDMRDAIEEVMKKAGGGENRAGMDESGKVASHVLSFDSQQNQLEPIYYWVLDFAAQIGFPLKEKLIDNFMASPGSGQFSEMSGKATRLQEEGMKILGGMNQIIKSVLNLIYDLKEFELRLEHYDDANSDDPKKREAGRLALKQIWLDNVDIKRQRGAIHAMANEMGFSTLREAFMMADSEEDVKKMNSEDKKEGGSGLINDSVMRILIPRIEEFNKWVEYSHKELTKRFSIEKNYLRSQVESVKLYSQWMKPYLENAEKLRQQGFEKDAAMVNAFSTSMFELQLMGAKATGKKDNDIHGYKLRRGYNAVIIVTFKYRGHVSQRVTQKGDYGFGMGGVVDMYFDAYALNDEELKAARKLLEKDEIAAAAEFSMDVAGEALKDLKEDLDYFLKPKKEREAEDEKAKGKKKEKKLGPFEALFGDLFKREKKEGKVEEVTEASEIRKDNYIEKKARAVAINKAAGTLYTIYDVYKKAHRMASAPGDGFNNYDTAVSEALGDGGDVGIKEIFRGANPKG
jgi:hypothetical protein